MYNHNQNQLHAFLRNLHCYWHIWLALLVMLYIHYLRFLNTSEDDIIINKVHHNQEYAELLPEIKIIDYFVFDMHISLYLIIYLIDLSLADLI